MSSVWKMLMQFKKNRSTSKSASRKLSLRVLTAEELFLEKAIWRTILIGSIWKGRITIDFIATLVVEASTQSWNWNVTNAKVDFWGSAKKSTKKDLHATCAISPFPRKATSTFIQRRNTRYFLVGNAPFRPKSWKNWKNTKAINWRDSHA